MRALLWVLLGLLGLLGSCRGGMYRFYRQMSKEAAVKTRRAFEPQREPLELCPFVCSLHTLLWHKTCAGAVIGRRWVLTAAHCVDRDLAYVTYNTATPYSGGNSVDVVNTYRHNEFMVNQRGQSQGTGVMELRHDVGLVKTGRDMATRAPPHDPLLHTYRMTPAALKDREVKVLGFRRIRNSRAEELFSVSLQLRECERGAAWFHCLCAVARPGDSAVGICALDSGGPVLYNGTIVGVVLMGPLECATRSEPEAGAASVFLSLYHYIDVVEATINGLKDVPTLRSDDFAVALTAFSAAADTAAPAATHVSTHLFTLPFVAYVFFYY